MMKRLAITLGAALLLAAAVYAGLRAALSVLVGM